MDVNKILKSDYLDLLFEGRNKAYGGYELRKTYSKRVVKSLFVLVGISVLTITYGVLANIKSTKKETLNLTEVKLAEPPPIDPTKPPPPPPPPAPPPPVKPTVAFTPPVIKPDEEVKEEEKPPPANDERAISTKTVEGDPNGVDPGLVDTKGVEGPPAAPQILEYVEQMPEFNGNVQEYLGKHINYPDAAKENNVEGRVIVRFVVNEDGAITDAKVVRGIGSGCDEEAIRVIKSMPKWKPGKQNGRAVKVWFTQPITFRLE